MSVNDENKSASYISDGLWTVAEDVYDVDELEDFTAHGVIKWGEKTKTSSEASETSQYIPVDVDTCQAVDGRIDDHWSTVSDLKRRCSRNGRGTRGGIRVDNVGHVQSKSFDTEETALSSSSSDDISTRTIVEDVEHGLVKVTTTSSNVHRERATSTCHRQSDIQQYEIDPSLVLSMERTLFSALSISWLFAVGGIGLMAIGDDDHTAVRGGITMVVLSMVTVVVSFGMHCTRLQHFKKDPTRTGVASTVVWTGLMSLVLLSFLVCELHYGIMHPYLERTASVAIENNNDKPPSFGKSTLVDTSEPPPGQSSGSASSATEQPTTNMAGPYEPTPYVGATDSAVTTMEDTTMEPTTSLTNPPTRFWTGTPTLSLNSTQDGDELWFEPRQGSMETPQP